jgi:predicted ribosome quality control (RQC) complex YloA/Tae2 family protein
LSLNWREIDRILAELQLPGVIIRQVYQPAHPLLVLELYRDRASSRLLICFANPNCRLHLTTLKPANPQRPQRFVSFLRSRVRDGRIVNAVQLGRERIVRLEVVKGEDRLLLWVRLWGGAANLIVTDPEGTVLDALYRRPKRGEVSGGRYWPAAELWPETGTPNAEEEDRFQVRELPGEGSFNERVARYYEALEAGQERERLTAAVRSRLQRRESRLEAGLESLRGRRQESGRFEELKRCGELILAHLHEVRPGERWLTARAFDDPQLEVRIELDPRATPAENAEAYFRRYRKAKAALERQEEDRQAQERELGTVRRELEQLAAETDLAALRTRAAALTERKPERDKGSPPGLEFASGLFRLLVGRSAAENDTLLRRHVRGNDTWLHARDAPGAYVFIRALPGKSVPLDTLLDAANLALHYSKAKGSGRGDVYYTQVKYLRRAREAKAGLVLPTQEKNLHVRLDPERLRRLLGAY